MARWIKKKKEKKEELLLPSKVEEKLKSHAYEVYKREEVPEKYSLYEKLCNWAERKLKVSPDKKTRKELERAIKVSHLKITPEGSTSLAVMFFGVSMLILMILLITRFLGFFGIDIMLFFVLSIVVTLVFLYLYKYPLNYAEWYKMKVKSDMVLMILYMVIYMRYMPNIENAFRFAAENISGPLGKELRKMLWDLEMGRYKNIGEALEDFLDEWKNEKYFIHSIELLQSALSQSGENYVETLNEAVDHVLRGSREKAKHYNQNMRVPTMVLHALGILLPTIGMVMFPMMAVFLSDIFKPAMLFVGYDVLLPLVLFFFMSNILKKRPISFSEVDISENPNIPPRGKFELKIFGEEFYIDAFIPSLIVGIPIVSFGLYLMKITSGNLWASLLVTVGLYASLALYFHLISFQKVGLRNKIKEMEDEFGEVLFKLGNRVAYGTPLESIFENPERDVKNLSLKEFFETVARNIEMRSMTVKEALFNEKYGALAEFPSKMIKSVMKIIIQSSQKGVSILSMTMMSIARYLKYLHETEEEIRDILSEVTSSIKFQAMILTPVVAGVVTTLASVIINILNQLFELSQAQGGVNAVPLGGIFSMWSSIPITPGMFQIIVGIYAIETAILLSWFANGIESADDEIDRWKTISKTLFISMITYVIVLSFSWATVGNLAMKTVLVGG